MAQEQAHDNSYSFKYVLDLGCNFMMIHLAFPVLSKSVFHVAWPGVQMDFLVYLSISGFEMKWIIM